MNNNKIDIENVQPVRKVSQVIFDEATGTLTLKLASEEEIAETEKSAKEQSTVKKDK